MPIKPIYVDIDTYDRYKSAVKGQIVEIVNGFIPLKLKKNEKLKKSLENVYGTENIWVRKA